MIHGPLDMKRYYAWMWPAQQITLSTYLVVPYTHVSVRFLCPRAIRLHGEHQTGSPILSEEQ